MTRGRFAAFATVLALVVGLVLTWPLVLHLPTHVLDDGTLDAFQFTWNVWWVKESLLGLHRLPFRTHHLFYPDGVPLLFHTGAFSLGLLALPLTLVAGPVVSMNVLVITAPALTFLAVAALAREATGDRWAALLAGALGAITPLAVWVLPVIYLSCGWIPPALLWLWWTMQRRRRWSLVWATLGLLAFAVFASQEYAMTSVALVGLDVAVRAVLARSLGLPPLWGRGTALFFLGATGLLGALAALALAEPAQPPPADQTLLASGFLLGFVTPPWCTQWPIAFARVFYLGSVSLPLAALALTMAPRRAAYWVLLLVPTLAMVLGPAVHLHPPYAAFTVGSSEGLSLPPLPGPYLLAGEVFPLLRFLRAPYRWMTAANPLCAVLAAVGVAALRSRLRRYAAVERGVAAALLACAATVPLLENYPVRAPMVAASVPPAYTIVRTDPAEAALLDLPSGLVQGGFALLSSRYMFYQTTHGKFLLDGTVSRLPPDRRMVFARRIQDFAAFPWLKYVVVHRDLLAQVGEGPRRQTEVLAARAAEQGRLVARDPTTDVYELATFRPDTVWSPRARRRSLLPPG